VDQAVGDSLMMMLSLSDIVSDSQQQQSDISHQIEPKEQPRA
jgi:hypothetical protein